MPPATKPAPMPPTKPLAEMKAYELKEEITRRELQHRREQKHLRALLAVVLDRENTEETPE